MYSGFRRPRILALGILLWFLFSALILLVPPQPAEAATYTVGTRGALNIATTYNYQWLEKVWYSNWYAPSAPRILNLHIKYVLRPYYNGAWYTYDRVYLYYQVRGNSTWYYYAYWQGLNNDFWVDLTSRGDVVGVKVVLYTSYSYTGATAWVDGPEANLDLAPPIVPGKPQLPYDTSVGYWQQKVTWSSNNNPAGTTYELWRQTYDPSQLVQGLFVNVFDTYNWYTTRAGGNSSSVSGHPNNHDELMTFFDQSKVTKVFTGTAANIDWTSSPFSLKEFFSVEYRGFIYAPVDGWYQFATDSDDASEIEIDGQIVVGWYGPHGPAGNWSHNGSIYLKAGWHNFVYRMEEAWGGEAARAAWKKPGDADFSVIPASAFAIPKLVEDRAVYSGTGISWVSTDQVPNRLYTYRVRAYYGGKWSEFSPETFYANVGQPQANPGVGSVTVMWPATWPGMWHRVWYREAGGQWQVAAVTGFQSHTITGLSPTKIYEVAVDPLLGEGGTDWWYGTGQVCPLAFVPGTPTFGRSGSNNIQVSWSPNGNPPGVVYELFRDGNLIYRGTATSYNDTGLGPNEVHRYKVRAKNAAGQYTEFTPEVEWKTAPGVPVIRSFGYSGISWSNTGDGQVELVVTWSQEDGAAGYKVYLDGVLAPGGDVGNRTYWKGTVPSGAPVGVQVAAYSQYGEGTKSETVYVTRPVRKDTAAPQVKMLINNGQLIAPSKYVVVSVSAVDPLQPNSTQTSADDASNPKLVRFSNDNSNWSGWVPYGFSAQSVPDASNDFEGADFYFRGDPLQPNGVYLNIGDGWSVATHYNSGVIKSMADGGFHGRKYVRFEHDGSQGWKGMWKPFTITGGKWYRITVYARTNSTTAVDLSRNYAFYSYSNDFRKNFTWEKEIKADNGWVKGQAVFQAPDTLNGGIYLYGLDNGPQGVTVDYDYVAVEVFDQQPGGDIIPDMPYPWTLDDSGFGKKTVYVQVRDAAGNIGSAQADINYYLVDMQAPQVKLTINGGQQYTSAQDVMLEIDAKDDLTQADLLQMRFSNDFQNWSSWETYVPYRKWTLTAGDGMKTVYVQVKDTSGNVGTAYASIVLQATNPGVQTDAAVFSSTSGVPGRIVLNGRETDVRFIKGAEVVLTLNAPGASWVQYSLDNVRWTQPEPVQPTKMMALPDWEGTKTVYARLSDGRTYSLTFVIDRTPPTIQASWKGGATATTTGSATAVLAATDNFTPEDQLEVSTDGTNWQPFASEVVVNLPQSGYNLVTILVRDKAGNVTKQVLGIWNI